MYKSEFLNIELTRVWHTGDTRVFNFPYLHPFYMEWEHWEEKVDSYECYYTAHQPLPIYKATLVTLTVFHKFISAN